MVGEPCVFVFLDIADKGAIGRCFSFACKYRVFVMVWGCSAEMRKMNDEKNIRFILNNLGYQTSVSKGYMFYSYDEDIYDTLDLRRGVIYAKK